MTVNCLTSRTGQWLICKLIKIVLLINTPHHQNHLSHWDCYFSQITFILHLTAQTQKLILSLCKWVAEFLSNFTDQCFQRFHLTPSSKLLQLIIQIQKKKLNQQLEHWVEGSEIKTLALLLNLLSVIFI